jgi:hypothetical protein
MAAALYSKNEKITIGRRYRYTIKEILRFYGKWVNLRANARHRGVQCLLSFDDYVKKARRAGISPEQIGTSHGQYQMCRKTDQGDYTVRSCRFGTVQENHNDMIRNGGTASSAAKHRGRTKDTSPGIARQAAMLKGRTKHTCPAVASMARELTGRTKGTHRGLAEMADANAKDFVIFYPSGRRHMGRNLKEFCTKNGLHASNMASVLRGERAHHKGYTGYYPE